MRHRGHDAETGEELWRRRIVARPRESGDGTWSNVPYENRVHVGSWTVPSVDPEPESRLRRHVRHLASPEVPAGRHRAQAPVPQQDSRPRRRPGEIRWYYQHLNDHWDLHHPFERVLVDTAVAPDPSAVSWINPAHTASETRRVVTGIPGKTGVVYTLDRATGEFLWATPTVPQNVIPDIDGATAAITPNGEIVFTAEGQPVLACPSWFGGKDCGPDAYGPLTNTMYMPLRNVCARMLASTDAGSHYALALRNQIAPGLDRVGTMQAISAETGETRWLHS